MIVETTRLIDRWLRHPEYGVAAMLVEVPRNLPGGGVDPLPIMPTILNDTEHEEVAAEIDPPGPVSLVLFADSDVEFDATDKHRQVGRQIVIAVAYITKDTPALTAVRDGGYVLRAVRRSLTRYNNQTLAVGHRELNGVKVAAIGQVTQQRVSGAVGKSQLWGFVLMAVTVIDSIP